MVQWDTPRYIRTVPDERKNMQNKTLFSASFKTFYKKVISILSKDYIFLLLLFAFGLIFLPSYGAHLDQQSEQEILYYNVLSYCDNLGIFPEFAEYLKERSIIPIEESIERDHGMSVFYPMFFIWKVRDASVSAANLLWHLYIYFFCFAGVSCLYLLLKDMLGQKTAVFSSLFFFLTPRIFADIHYNNKDAILLSLSLIVFYLAYRLREKTNVLNAILFGFAGAVIGNMRVIGLFIWGIMGLWVLFSLIAARKFKPSVLVKIAICFASAVALFALITPAVWAGPVSFFKYQFESAKNFRWGSSLLFAGKIYSKDVTGFSRKYLPVTVMMTLPLSVMALSIAGGIRIIVGFFKKDNNDIKQAFFGIFAAFAGFFPFGYAVISNATVYNGWRHFYFSFASIIILTAFGVKAFLEIKKQNAVTIALSAILLTLFAGICINHPYQYAYYNFPARLWVEDNFELDYWDMAFNQALKRIGEYDDGEITVACVDSPSIWGVNAQLNNALSNSLSERIHPVSSWETGEYNLENAEYIIINPTYSAIYNPAERERIRGEYELLWEIKAYGNVICEVYRR